MSKNSIVDGMEKISPFGLRLREAFDNHSNKEIADKLEIGKSAITAYMQGRIPPYETLLKIHALTSCNLHLLLIGEGERVFRPNSTKMPTVIVLQSDKGGAGTSSSATSIAASLSLRGFRTLLVECRQDSTCGYSLFFDLYEKHKNNKNLPEFVFGLSDGSCEVFNTGIKNLFLYTFDEKLKDILQFEDIGFSYMDYKTVKQKYDFVIVDAFSRTNPFTHKDGIVNDLLKFANLLIVYDGSNYGINHTSFMLSDLQESKAELNRPHLLGLFFSKVKNKSKGVPPQILNKLGNIEPKKIFKTQIRHSIIFPGNLYPFNKTFGKRKSQVIEDYEKLVDEILAKLEIDDRNQKN